MNDETLDGQLLALVREIRSLEHRVAVLRSRDSANSRTLQAELQARIGERERQLVELRDRSSVPGPSGATR